MLIIKKSRGKSLSASSVFIALSLFFLILFVFALLCTRGEALSWLFFKDALDTGMDFFHSIEYVRGRSPYEVWQTLYPPLANAFFYICYLVIPMQYTLTWAGSFEESVAMRGTSADLRVHQSSMFIFIVYVVLISLILFLLVKELLRDRNKSSLIAFLFVISFGVLYSLERGNIILIAVALCLLFLYLKDFDNKIFREISLICLAAAFALKLYPVFLGCILLYERRWKEAARCALYGAILFFGPFVLFKEGIAGLPIFLTTVLSHSNSTAADISGFTPTKILVSFITIFHSLIGQEAPELNLSSLINFAFTALVIVLGFFQKENWKRVTCCVLAMLFFSYQVTYILVFLFLPLMACIREKDILDNRRDALLIICLCLTQVLIPLPRLFNTELSFSGFVAQLGLVIIFVLIAAPRRQRPKHLRIKV